MTEGVHVSWPDLKVQDINKLTSPGTFLRAKLGQLLVNRQLFVAVATGRRAYRDSSKGSALQDCEDIHAITQKRPRAHQQAEHADWTLRICYSQLGWSDASGQEHRKPPTKGDINSSNLHGRLEQPTILISLKSQHDYACGQIQTNGFLFFSNSTAPSSGCSAVL